MSYQRTETVSEELRGFWYEFLSITFSGMLYAFVLRGIYFLGAHYFITSQWPHLSSGFSYWAVMIGGHLCLNALIALVLKTSWTASVKLSAPLTFKSLLNVASDTGIAWFIMFFSIKPAGWAIRFVTVSVAAFIAIYHTADLVNELWVFAVIAQSFWLFVPILHAVLVLGIALVWAILMTNINPLRQAFWDLFYPPWWSSEEAKLKVAKGRERAAARGEKYRLGR